MTSEGKRSHALHCHTHQLLGNLVARTFGVFSLHTILDAPDTWLLIMTCASAVLSHVISCLLMSCDRISIKLQLTGKFRLTFQFYVLFQDKLCDPEKK